MVVAGTIGCLFPVPAFDLALVFMSQTIVVVFPLLLFRVFPAAAGNEHGAGLSLASNHRLHFSMRDLFKGTILIAAVLAVVARLPGEVKTSWLKYVTLGAGFGVATLAGTFAALVGRHWAVRL